MSDLGERCDSYGRGSIRSGVATVLATCVLAMAGTAAQGPVPPVFTAQNARTPLDWAQDLVGHVALADTSYAHGAARVTWAGQHGETAYVSHADCSSFLEALLTQAYGVTPDQFRSWLGKRRPYARDFFDAIEAENGFARVRSLSQVRPGDVIAIRYVNSAPGDNTGHIMLVAAAPGQRAASKPIVADTLQWDVLVIDSSESGHGKADTRRMDDGKLHAGVGRGTLRIYSDRQGAIRGYAWSDFADSVFYDDARPIVIGRLKTAGAAPVVRAP